MGRRMRSFCVLGLALGMMAIPSGGAQEKPAPPPPLAGGRARGANPSQQKPVKPAPPLPGQKGGEGKPAQQGPAAVAVEIVNRIPPEDKDNLKGYWAGVETRTGERWQHMAEAKTATDAVRITGWIHTDGRITGLAVEHGSGKVSVDRAAVSAVAEAAPFDPFPYGIAVEEVKVRFTLGAGAAAPGTPGGGPPKVVH